MIYLVTFFAITGIVATPKLTQIYARHLSKTTYLKLSEKLNAMPQN